MHTTSVISNQEITTALLFARDDDDDDGDTSAGLPQQEPNTSTGPAAFSSPEMTLISDSNKGTHHHQHMGGNNDVDIIKAKWQWIIWTPIVFVAVVGPILVPRYGAWTTLGVTVFLLAWGLWTGTHDAVFLMVQGQLFLLRLLDGDDDNGRATMSATALCIFFYQALLICGIFERTRTPAGNYPIPTLPISYLITFVSWMIAIGLLLETRRFLALRVMMQALLIPVACITLVLFLLFAVFLSGVDSIRVLQHDHTNKKLLSSLARLVSMACVLASTLISDGDIRLACFFQFISASNLAASIQTSIIGISLKDEPPSSEGHFAPPTRKQSTYAVMALLATAIAILLPLLATFTYNMFLRGGLDARAASSDQDNDLWLIILQCASFLVSMFSPLAASFVIGPKPLQWKIFVFNHVVVLSVHTMGRTVMYHGIVHASKHASILGSSAVKGSFITNSIRGVVVVDYFDSTRHAAKCNKLQIQMTPEDPNAFLEIMARAIKQAKAAS